MYRQDLYQNVQVNISVSLPWDQWWPTIDGWVLTDNTSILYQEAAINPHEKFNVDRVIWGFNSQDTVIWCGNCPNNSIEYRQVLMEYFSEYNSRDANASVDALINYYYPLRDYYNDTINAWYSLNSDVCVICPILEINEQFANYTRDDDEDSGFQQFVYYFEGTSWPYYAGHGSELVFLLIGYQPQNASNYGMKYNRTLSDEMIYAWQEFANTSYNASAHTLNFYDEKNDSMFEWIEYASSGKSQRNVIRFNENTANVPNFRSQVHRNDVCTFWHTIDYNTRFNLCSNSMYY